MFRTHVGRTGCPVDQPAIQMNVRTMLTEPSGPMRNPLTTSAMLSIFGRAGATLYELQAQSVYLMSYTIKWPVTKRNTARSANLHVLVYALLHREAPYQVVQTYGSP